MKTKEKTILGSWACDWLNGKAMQLDEEDMQICLEELEKASKEERADILEDLNKAIEAWLDSFVLSSFDSNATDCLTIEELDELYYTDEDYRKRGIAVMGRDELVDAIERIGYINGYHEDAINMAWYERDMDFLLAQWEDLALAQISIFKEELKRKRTTMTKKAHNGQQRAKREGNETLTYPPVFGMEACSSITGYSTSTLYKLTSRNAIPCHRAGKNGRKLFFKLDEILDWLTTREQETINEFIERMDKSLTSKYSSICIS